MELDPNSESVPQPGDALPNSILLPPPGAIVPGGEKVSARPKVKAPLDTRQDRDARAKKAAAEAAELVDGFSPREISIVDAVRLALANNPDVQLAVADAELAEATRRGISGAFDTNLQAQIDWSRRYRESKDSEKLKERSQYKAIRELYQTATIALDRIEKVKSGKASPDDFSLEGTPLEDVNSEINREEDPDDQRIQELEMQRDLKVNAILKILANGSGNPEVDKLARQAVLIQERVFRQLQRSTARTLVEQPPWIVNGRETHNYEMSVIKKMRGGPQLRVFGRVNGTETNFGTRSDDPRENRSSVGMDVSVNLLKLGAADPETAQELIATERVKAQQELARAKMASLVQETVDAYWRLAAAQERLRYLILSKVETAATAALVESMVGAGLIAPRDGARYQVIAQLANAEANTYSAQIEMATAQQALAITMGLDPREVMAAPLAADPLPGPVDEADVKALDFRRLVDYTTSHHANLIAFQYLGNANRIQVEQARLDVRPDFRLFASGEFTGYNQQTGWDGYFGVWGTNQTGPSMSFGGRFDWPIENNARKAAVTEAATQAQRNDLLADAARRRLATDIALSLRKLMATSAQAQKYAEARAQFEDALGAQRKKLGVEDITVLDVIQTEQNLTQSRLTEVRARLEHAVALASLRQGTFTILPPFTFQNTVDSGARSNVRLNKDYFTGLPSNAMLSPPATVVNPAWVAPSSPPLLERLTGGGNADATVHLPRGAPAPRSATPEQAGPASADRQPATASAPPQEPAVQQSTRSVPSVRDRPRPLLERLFGN